MADPEDRAGGAKGGPSAVPPVGVQGAQITMFSWVPGSPMGTGACEGHTGT